MKFAMPLLVLILSWVEVQASESIKVYFTPNRFLETPQWYPLEMQKGEIVGGNIYHFTHMMIEARMDVGGCYIKVQKTEPKDVCNLMALTAEWFNDYKGLREKKHRFYVSCSIASSGTVSTYLKVEDGITIPPALPSQWPPCSKVSNFKPNN